ncbi:MAG: hypothetical protein EBS91_08850 [Betaproteobacteria bacterium]|nr:hypothetical protein [Betaproteobacteria bacterium]NCA24688.1 hypothetical protein [Betaproteobacteria bacterium]
MLEYLRLRHRLRHHLLYLLCKHTYAKFHHSWPSTFLDLDLQLALGYLDLVQPEFFHDQRQYEQYVLQLSQL